MIKKQLLRLIVFSFLFTTLIGLIPIESVSAITSSCSSEKPQSTNGTLTWSTQGVAASSGSTTIYRTEGFIIHTKVTSQLSPMWAVDSTLGETALKISIRDQSYVTYTEVTGTDGLKTMDFVVKESKMQDVIRKGFPNSLSNATNNERNRTFFEC